MNLEDHVGDILRKARQAAQVSVSTAAAAAGIDEVSYEEMEASGRWAGEVRFEAIARRVGLDGPKLEAIAQGWTPAPVDLATWRELRQISTAEDGNAVNCYLVWDEVTREAALFDTGWEAAPIIELIEQNELELRHLFLTHSHTDHVAALGKLRTKYPKIKLHSSFLQAPADQRNRPNDFIQVGSLRLTNRETPGHSEDGVTYVIGGFPEDAPHVAVVGDALFAGSMGRGFQSTDLLRKKVHEHIFSLPPTTLLCPGHGPLTTVAEELAHNPFF